MSDSFKRKFPRELEDEAIYIIREVAAQFERPVLLFSGGKDSITLVRLAQKAFYPARIPFPLLHIDTGHNFPETIGFRDQLAAELHLNPADMGPVSVQIVMDGTQARVDFGADVAATRQAIEAGLPELASALADAGFTLAGGGVSQHAGGRGSGSNADSRSPEGRRTRALAADDDTQQRITAAARRVVARGGIDLFA